jgi:hypothetical protein
MMTSNVRDIARRYWRESSLTPSRSMGTCFFAVPTMETSSKRNKSLIGACPSRPTFQPKSNPTPLVWSLMSVRDFLQGDRENFIRPANWDCESDQHGLSSRQSWAREGILTGKCQSQCMGSLFPLHFGTKLSRSSVIHDPRPLQPLVASRSHTGNTNRARSTNTICSSTRQ